MTHDQFVFGLEFWLGDRQWRCTDIGTRTIVAIQIDPIEIVTLHESKGITRRRLTRAEADHLQWFAGPPYAVTETAFDENDLKSCSLAQPEIGSRSDKI